MPELTAVGFAVSVTSRTVGTAPSVVANGSRYIVPAGATGIWSGRTNQIAHRLAAGWAYYAPPKGATTLVLDEDVNVQFDGGAWQTGSTKHRSFSVSALATSGTLAAAIGIGLPATPAGDIDVFVGGLSVEISYSTSSGYAFFSADNGVTARAQNAIVAGDVLFWNGVAAGFQLATTDIVSISFDS